MRAAPRRDRRGMIYLRKGHGRLSRPLVVALVLVALLPPLLIGVAGVGAIFAGYSYYTTTVRAADLPHLRRYSFQNARIYDRNGKLLYEAEDPQHGVRHPVPLRQIPLALQQATIATEDKTFYQNLGFDVAGVARAARDDVSAGHVVGGGSSITQQLVKNMLLTDEPTFQRKARELALSYALTQRFSKGDILDMYLNTAFYGARAYGVEAAAQVYFHHDVQDLDLAQCALLAGLPQSPSLYTPLVHPKLALTREQQVLNRMVQQGYVTPERARAAMTEAHGFTFSYPTSETSPALSGPAGQFVQYVLEQLEATYGQELYGRGLQVYTTLDLNVQRYAQQQLAAQIKQMGPTHNMHDGAVVVLNRQGQIVAMVGSANPRSTTPQGAGQVNMAVWPTLPGSSFKLYTYLTAFEHGFAPATVVDDNYVSYPMGWDTYYTPHNYDLRYHGSVTVRVALANSYNIPAIKVESAVGIGKVLDMAHRLGVTTLNGKPQDYGLAFTLGYQPVPLLETANAYDTVARGGIWQPTTPILRITDADGNPVALPTLAPTHRVISTQNAYLMTSILSDNFARIREFGYNSVLQLPTTPAAVKTGTTDDFRDNVTVGYTPQYTTAVWVGNANHEAMHNVIGIDGAGPVWHAVMKHLTLNQQAQPFIKPPGVTVATVSGYSGGLAVPGSGWTITDVFSPSNLPHRKDNPATDSPASFDLWDGYSMNVHDGNWDYPATRRYALPVGGPLNAPAMASGGAAGASGVPQQTGTTGGEGSYTVTQIGPGAHPPSPGMAYTYTYAPGPDGQMIYTYHYYYPGQ